MTYSKAVLVETSVHVREWRYSYIL